MTEPMAEDNESRHSLCMYVCHTLCAHLILKTKSSIVTKSGVHVRDKDMPFPNLDILISD